MTTDELAKQVFADTAILLLHPDEDKKRAAKERLYALMYPKDTTP